MNLNDRPHTMRMLVSVKSIDEALLAAEGGADFIDLKDPARGALGGLPVTTIAAIVGALRAAGSRLPVSATIGDWASHEHAAIAGRVDAVGACGVDYVKVGIERGAGAAALLQALAASRWAIVPVFIADAGLDDACVAQACAAGFPGLMVDTADKHRGSLFDVIGNAELGRFVAAARAAGALAGLAGALRLADLPRVAALAPDFAGFRSAVCAGERSGALDLQRLQGLAAALRSAQAAVPALG